MLRAPCRRPPPSKRCDGSRPPQTRRRRFSQPALPNRVPGRGLGGGAAAGARSVVQLTGRSSASHISDRAESGVSTSASFDTRRLSEPARSRLATSKRRFLIRLDRMITLHPNPVRLADLIREGKLLWCYCRDCCREDDVDPAAVPLPGGAPVREVGRRMVCSACGGRNVETKPELYPGGIRAARQLATR